MPRSMLFVATLAVALLPSAAPATKPEKLDPARIERLAALLPAQPQGVGRPITDRQAWDAVAAVPKFRAGLREAEKLLKQPIAELSDDAYLDFSRTGNRTRGQAVLSKRFGRIAPLVLAECVENRGRFLSAIEAAIRATCADKTWVMPAHDRNLSNFKGTGISIDLRSSAVSWELATACAWLGDKLSPEVRKLVRDELQRRIFQPYLAAVQEGKGAASWLHVTNNWNAVCLAGVTGAALATLDAPRDRALFVAAAEKYIQNFIDGFTSDGYCSEGLGYWNYGFGHFVYLSETIRQATGGQVDFMAGTKIPQMASFARRLEILPGIYPAFADCSPNSQPDPRLMAFLSRRFGWGLKEVEDRNLLLAPGPVLNLFQFGLLGFANSASQMPAASSSAAAALHDWFAEAGILVCRPAPGQPGMGVALKGGHNAEHHNHNDVGSFVVALGHGTPLLDPGSEVYTARTFSSKRYESNVLNSFGHAVPRVAGQLQRPGRDAAAKILKTTFTDQLDTLVMDISSAYPVTGLKKLQRTFVYSRPAGGGLKVVDEVEFDRPQAFGTALITFSKWKSLSPTRLLVGEGAEAVEVDLAAEGGTLQLQAEEIKEDLHHGLRPIRLGIDLSAPAKQAAITVTIAPVKR